MGKVAGFMKKLKKQLSQYFKPLLRPSTEEIIRNDPNRHWDPNSIDPSYDLRNLLMNVN